MNTVGFPNLGIEVTMDPWAFSLFGLPIAWYALIITGGMILASLYIFKNLKKFGLDPDSVLDVLLGGMIGAIIGARLYYVIFSWDYFRENTGEIWNLRMGGLAFYGGVIGGVAVGLLVCKLRRVKMLPMLDVAGMGFLIGQGIGRWGNFVNVEAYGAETSPDFLLGMSSNMFPPGIELVHPCFLYESVWSLLGFLVLHLIFVRGNRRQYDGQLALLYLVWNGAGRAVIEGLRTDSLYLLGVIRISQLLAICMVVVGGGMLVYLHRRNQRQVPLYVNTEESKLILEMGALRKKDPTAYREKREEFDQLQEEKKQQQKAELASLQVSVVDEKPEESNEKQKKSEDNPEEAKDDAIEQGSDSQKEGQTSENE